MAVVKYLNYALVANLLLMSLFANVFAGDKSNEDIIKQSVIKHFKKQKITFVYIGKTKAQKYFVIIRYKHAQDRVIVDKNGTILSISEDLEAMDAAEEGC